MDAGAILIGLRYNLMVKRIGWGALLLAAAGCGQNLGPNSADAELTAAWSRAKQLGLSLDTQLPPPPAPEALELRADLARWVDQRGKLESAAWRPGASPRPITPPRPADIAALDDPVLDKAAILLDGPIDRLVVIPPALLDRADYDRTTLKAAAQAMVWRAVEHAQAGRREAALKDLASARRLERVAGLNMQVIGATTAEVMHRNWLQGLQTCAEIWRDIDEALALLEQMVDQEEKPTPLREYMAYEFEVGVNTIRNFEKYGGIAGVTKLTSGTSDSGEEMQAIDIQELSLSGHPASPLTREMAAQHIRIWAPAFEAESVSDIQLGKLLSDSKKQAERDCNSQLELCFHAYTTTDFTQLAQLRTAREVRLSMMRAGLQALRRYGETGRFEFPGKLKAEVDGDAFSLRATIVGSYTQEIRMDWPPREPVSSGTYQ